MNEARKDFRPIFWIVALISFLFDQGSKWWVNANMPLNTRILFPSVDPYFKFTHVANYGSAFSIIKNANTILLVVVMVVSLWVIWINYQLPAHHRTPHWALGLILGGAIGNWIDRVRLGYVTDFLDIDVSSLIDVPLANWPVFNLADLSVVVGGCLLAYLSLFRPQELGDELESTTEKESADSTQLS